jgi:hypothetical protein
MNDAFSADSADTLPFTPNTPYGRPSWSGLLQFSLVGIPLKAYPAVRTRDVPSAHLLHADCGQRIRYAKQCPIHGTVDGAAILRGYEYGPGRHVIAQPDELDALRPVQDKALRLERFLTPDQLNPLLFAGRSLYCCRKSGEGTGRPHQSPVVRGNEAALRHNVSDSLNSPCEVFRKKTIAAT